MKYKKKSLEKNINQNFHKKKGFVAEKVKEDDLFKSYLQDLRKEIDEVVSSNKYLEKENIEIAKNLSDKSLSESENRVVLVEKTIRQLYDQTKQNPQDTNAKKELSDFVSNSSKDKQLIENLRTSARFRAPALTQRIIYRLFILI